MPKKKPAPPKKKPTLDDLTKDVKDAMDKRREMNKEDQHKEHGDG